LTCLKLHEKLTQFDRQIAEAASGTIRKRPEDSQGRSPDRRRDKGTGRRKRRTRRDPYTQRFPRETEDSKDLEELVERVSSLEESLGSYEIERMLSARMMTTTPSSSSTPGREAPRPRIG
jgi:hypothetical protein